MHKKPAAHTATISGSSFKHVTRIERIDRERLKTIAAHNDDAYALLAERFHAGCARHRLPEGNPNKDPHISPDTPLQTIAPAKLIVTPQRGEHGAGERRIVPVANPARMKAVLLTGKVKPTPQRTSAAKRRAAEARNFAVADEFARALVRAGSVAALPGDPFMRGAAAALDSADGCWARTGY